MSGRGRGEVVWSDLAIGDLEELSDFVAAEDLQAARALEQWILGATTALVRHPRRGRVVPELLGLGLRLYREVIVAPYRVVYRAASGRVFVLAVLHGARDVEVALRSRLTRPRAG